jgi:hypothetical protein
MNTNLLSVVRQIIADNGEAIFNEPARLKALFGDLAKDEPKPLRLAFGRCVEAGAYTALKTAADQAERVSRKTAIAQRVLDEHGLDVTLCGEALDILETALFGTVSEAQPRYTPSPAPSYQPAPYQQPAYQQPQYQQQPYQQPVYQQPQYQQAARKNPWQYLMFLLFMGLIVWGVVGIKSCDSSSQDVMQNSQGALAAAYGFDIGPIEYKGTTFSEKTQELINAFKAEQARRQGLQAPVDN